MIRPSKHSTETSPYDFALERTVVRSLKDFPAFLEGAPGVIVLVAPQGYDLPDYGSVLVRVVSCAVGDLGPCDGGLLYVKATDSEAKIQTSFDRELQNYKRIIVLAETRDNLPPLLMVAVDAVVELSPVTADDLKAACKATLGQKISIKQAAAALQFPSKLLWAALRPGRTIEETLQRLSSVPSIKTTRDAGFRPLTDMYGYGEAKQWGLQLAVELTEWRRGNIVWEDVDRGILLSGPPGVGKTIFARALAKQCDVDLVACSLGRWQAAGHLGDLLKAMRGDFAKAKASAPSILFIDELDSFGDRATFDQRHADYSTQVVNALLECIDGLDGREGVVIVGATNSIARIDPAILRSGRLDRHVEIPYPSPEDRLGILSQLTGLSFSPEAVEHLHLKTAFMTGADLAKVARDARRLARNERRAIDADDVNRALPQTLRFPEDYHRAVAFHEAGHTVVGFKLRYGRFHGTTVARYMPTHASTFQAGLAQFKIPVVSLRKRESYLNEIAVLLAGVAAEEIWLGGVSEGAGGPGSDLARATRLATLIETSMGMGTTLRYSHADSDRDLELLRRNDQRLCSRIDDILDQQFKRARAILMVNQALAKSVARELLDCGRVTRETLSELVRTHPTFYNE